MNYIKIKKFDIANGPGVRVSLWVSGCPHRCPGCFNPETWNYQAGEKWDHRREQELIEALSPDYISGLTILGGEPLAPQNSWDVFKICKSIRLRYPRKSIWIYTGYTWEQVRDLLAMAYVDVVVDGPFIEGEKNISLLFRGSENQRIIDVRASLGKSEPILWSVENERFWGGPHE